MCVRYFENRASKDEIYQIVNGRSINVDWEHTGDIRPADRATMIIADSHALLAEDMRWGFPSPVDNKLLVNARSETALTKKFFSESVRSRRCIIAAGGFYEWDKRKDKYTFSLLDQDVIFIAGFYNNFSGENRFIIITTDANSSMSPVHDRMPLILPKESIQEWILDDSSTGSLLHHASPLLLREKEIPESDQISLAGF